MQYKKILAILIIILLFSAYHYVIGSQRLCIRININRSYSDAKNIYEKAFCHLLTKDGQIEYETANFVILGGNTALLPAKKEGINVQMYLRENENSCTLVLGYPALPLESY